jgi:hypothetical protein
MGFVDDKKEVVNSVALFEVLGNLPKTKSVSSLESVNSPSLNLMKFLLDLFVVTCNDGKNTTPIPGKITYTKCDVKRILIDILIEFFPKLVTIIKQAIKEAIKAGLVCGTNFKLPNTNARVSIEMKNLDINGLTKIDPNTPIGSTFYGKDATKDFNRYLSDLAQTGGSGSWKGIINMNYSVQSQKLDVELNPSYLNNGGNTSFNGNTPSTPKAPSFDNFLNDYTDSLEIINKENLMARVTDKLTGSLSSGLGSSLEKFISQEKVSRLQDKINNSECGGKNYNLDDSFYTFSDEEVLEIEEISNQKYKGKTFLDLGCGIQEVSLDTDLFKKTFDDIRNANTADSTGVLVESLETINSDLTKNVSEENKENSKKSLNYKMIEEIPKVFADIIFEPKIMVLYQLCSKIVNGPLPQQPLPPLGTQTNVTTTTIPNIKVENSFDFSKANSVFFEYVVRKSSDALLEIILNKVKQEIIKIVKEQIILIIKEKAKMRAKAIKSTYAAKQEEITNKIKK